MLGIMIKLHIKPGKEQEAEDQVRMLTPLVPGGDMKRFKVVHHPTSGE